MMAFLDFHPMEFVKNLRYMGIGMLGIFIVIGVIAGLTLLLNFLTGGKEHE
ncbi:MAG: hypothetical protein MJ100_02970 [Ruminococcus sp.]|nr:hypothetical protein [Ruminococcus sp.]